MVGVEIVGCTLGYKVVGFKVSPQRQMEKKIQNTEIFVFIFMIERYKIPHIYVSVQ